MSDCDFTLVSCCLGRCFFFGQISFYQINQINQILQWSSAVWWGVGEVDPCWQVTSFLLCLPPPVGMMIETNRLFVWIENLASCEDICAPSFLPGQRTRSEDFPGSVVTSQPDAQVKLLKSLCLFKGMIKRRYHKWPWSHLARFDQGCTKGGIVQVGA